MENLRPYGVAIREARGTVEVEVVAATSSVFIWGRELGSAVSIRPLLQIVLTAFSQTVRTGELCAHIRTTIVSLVPETNRAAMNDPSFPLYISLLVLQVCRPKPGVAVGVKLWQLEWCKKPLNAIRTRIVWP